MKAEMDKAFFMEEIAPNNKTAESVMEFGDALMDELTDTLSEEQLDEIRDKTETVPVLLQIVKCLHDICQPYIDTDRMGELIIKSGLNPDIYDKYIATGG